MGELYPCPKLGADEVTRLMILTKEQARMVAGNARRWRDKFKHSPVVSLSAGEKADLMHILDELQHAVDHQLAPQLPSKP